MRNTDLMKDFRISSINDYTDIYEVNCHNHETVKDIVDFLTDTEGDHNIFKDMVQYREGNIMFMSDKSDVIYEFNKGSLKEINHNHDNDEIKFIYMLNNLKGSCGFMLYPDTK